jgi:hypothetical protein
MLVMPILAFPAFLMSGPPLPSDAMSCKHRREGSLALPARQHDLLLGVDGLDEAADDHRCLSPTVFWRGGDASSPIFLALTS